MAQLDKAAVRAIGLEDGRTLAYAEYGAPGGRPVLFFHGFPASHKEAALWHDTATRHSVRLIAPDRPGIGYSSYQPGRHFLDWPGDVVQLARNLGIDSCRILATAGGSPYALACVRHFGHAAARSNDDGGAPELRVEGAAIVSGIYPLALGPSDMQLSTRIALFIVGHLWFLLPPLLEWLLGRPARTEPALFAARMMREAASRPVVDRTCLADAAFGGLWIESARHVFEKDARGAAYEAGLMGRGWGFGLEGVDGTALSIWQGGFDEACPAALARRAHALLKGSTIFVFEYEGHLSIEARKQHEVFKVLMEES